MCSLSLSPPQMKPLLIFMNIFAVSLYFLWAVVVKVISNVNALLLVVFTEELNC